ncbi:YlcI/YnfO family protein [Edwardsiella tarda]
MATGAKNAKSQTIAARVPHDIADSIEELKAEGESTGQFVVTALRGEIKRRQRRKSKADTPAE